MKKTSYLFLSALVAAGMLSCTKENVNPLTGKYPVPEEVKSTSLEDGGITEKEGLNIYAVRSGSLSLDFAGRGWYLPAGDYVVSSELKAGTLQPTSNYGGKSFSKGTISVGKEADQYTLDGVLWLEDGTVLHVKANGKLTYEEVVVVPEYNYVLEPYMDGERQIGYNFTLMDLAGEFAANFLIFTTSSVAGTYVVTGDNTNLKDGDAFVGWDLSIYGMPPVGSYFVKDGKQWFVEAGTITISGDENMYSVAVDGLEASSGAEKYGSSSVVFANAVKAQPESLSYEGFSCTYSSKDDANTGWTEHVLSLKDAEGNSAGQMVVTTEMLQGLAGTFEPATETDKVGRYTTGLDLSAFGMGIRGSYFVVDGATYAISGGTMVISVSSGKVTVTINDIKTSMNNVASVSFPEMPIVEESKPDDPVVTPETFALDGGTYSYTSAPKSNAEGIIEHYFNFKDADGNDAGQLLIWTAPDAPYTGIFPYVSPMAPAAGNFAGGIEFDLSAYGMGISNLGSYFIKDGKTWLINAGTAVVAEEDGKIGVLISGVEAALGTSAGGEKSAVTTLSFSNMTKEAEPVTFLLEGGTYKYTTAPREGTDVIDHGFEIRDAEGNLVGAALIWAGEGQPYTGTFSYTEPTSPAVGTFAGGMNFYGVMDLGTYFIKDGKTWYVKAGTATVSEFFGYVSIQITGVKAEDAEGNASDVSVVSFSGMAAAVE